ncbi:MAG: hypothetical protein Fur0035_10650 [Anaerolineales bacterium]
MNLRKILLISFGILMALGIFFPAGLYAFNCQKNNTCTGIAEPVTTPIPTLIAATLPAPRVGAGAAPVTVKCQITAVELIGAWVSAGSPETDSFNFTDLTGRACAATFGGDVQRLFVEANIWYDGAPACTTCHYADVVKATQNMDLSSYAGILAGSQRANGEAKGKDILGGGVWQNALLRQMIQSQGGQSTINRPLMPLGRPASVPDNGPILFAGTPQDAVSAAAP